MAASSDPILRFVDGGSADFAVLGSALDAELIDRYPALADDPPSPVQHPRAAVVAYRDGAPVGCGALGEIEPGVGEIRRMFVVPEARGLGLGRKMLEALEARGRALGYSALRLGSGVRQPEALALYESSGYRRIAPYGEYEAGGELCVCYQKAL